nr:zinc finger protein 271-like [Leptinotarsa decemlineata]
MDPKLCDSNYCRLCAEENKNGMPLFSENENTNSLVLLVNKYLPVRVENDSKFPKTICPGCHIQLEATKIFMDLIISGQSKLRSLYQCQQEKLLKEARQKQQLEEALHSVNPNSTVETYTIHTDETGDKYLIQIYSKGPLFPPEHELSLKADGLERPKRKRGRPPKQIVEQNNADEKQDEKDEGDVETAQEEEDIGEDGRKRRKIKAPSRFAGEVQGKELEKILKEEGVLDDENFTDGTDLDPSVEETVIGRTENGSGKDLGEPIFIHRPKNRSRFGRLTNLFFMQSRNIGGIIRIPELPENVNTTPPAQPDPPYECPECRKTFLNKQNLDTHSRTVHSNERPFECKKCGKRFAYINSLKGHLAKHNREDPSRPSVEFPCDSCSKIFQHPSSLLYHQETEHSDGRRFVCTTCDKGFKHRQLLQRHQLVHSDERPFACDKCGVTFKTQANLTNHETLHTGEKRFCCGECGQKFAHRTSLSLHQRWHEGRKPFVCEFCNKAFSQKGNLLEHRRIHTGEKPFNCDRCGKSFTTSSQFNIHLKRHTGEKPWKCEYCEKSFLHKDTFSAHVRRHLDQRPFACAKCPRTFIEQWALKRHERMHTGARPYKCDHCDKTFSDSSNKNKHMRSHKFAENVKYVFAPANDVEEGDDLQVTQLVDRQGCPISITTKFGETVPVVSLGDDKETFQGLLPDGTLVPFEIASLDGNEDDEDVEINVLDSPSQEPVILSTDSIIQVNEDTLDSNLELLTDDNRQEICLVTYAINENGEVTQELTVDPRLLQN